MSASPTSRATKIETARAVQHRRHAEPATGKRVREGMEQRLRLRPIAIVGDEELRRCAERDEGVAVLDRSDADRRRRSIAGASGDDHRPSKPKRSRNLREDGSARRRSPRPIAASASRPSPLAARIGSDQSRAASSSQSVPAASDMSVANSPVSRSRRIVLRRDDLRDAAESFPARAASARGVSGR